MTYIYRADEDIQREPTVPYIYRAIELPPEVTYPERKKFKPELCGTPSGYQQHGRFNQERCPDCLIAYSEYQSEYRAAHKPESTGRQQESPIVASEITQFTTKIDSTRPYIKAAPEYATNTKPGPDH